MDELIKYLKALVLLQARVQGEGEAAEKSELLFLRAGFTSREIAEMLNKNLAAVQKTIERARKKPA